MRSWKYAFCAIAIAAGAMCQASKAETVTAELTGLDPYVGGTMSLAGYGDVSGGVGNIIWQGISTNPTPFNGVFNTYCIDLIQDIDFGNTYTFTEVPLIDAPKAGAFPTGTPDDGMGQTKADEIEALFGTHYSDTLPEANGLDREAFQLAIWNILYDTDTSVSQGSGSFYVINNSGLDAGAITLANTFLCDALNPANQKFDMTNLVGLIGANGAQDQIAVLPDPVPNPASGKAAGVILSGLALFMWRRNRMMRHINH